MRGILFFLLFFTEILSVSYTKVAKALEQATWDERDHERRMANVAKILEEYEIDEQIAIIEEMQHYIFVRKDYLFEHLYRLDKNAYIALFKKCFYHEENQCFSNVLGTIKPDVIEPTLIERLETILLDRGYPCLPKDGVLSAYRRPKPVIVDKARAATFLLRNFDNVFACNKAKIEIEKEPMRYGITIVFIAQYAPAVSEEFYDQFLTVNNVIVQNAIIEGYQRLIDARKYKAKQQLLGKLLQLEAQGKVFPRNQKWYAKCIEALRKAP